MRLTTMFAAAALVAGPALTQDAASDDCAFLQESFAGVYEGLRQMAGGDVESADPAIVTMFTAIQTNVILLAQGAGCDMDPMVQTARAQLERYAPGAME